MLRESKIKPLSSNFKKNNPNATFKQKLRVEFDF